MKHRIPTAFFMDLKAPRRQGRVNGLPLKEDVRITTDKWGIPRIEAANESDLYMAQGYVHASERLWQMESIRRFASGRLSEIAGDKLLELDHFARLAGFPEVCSRAVEGLSEKTRLQIEAYLSGINEFIDRHKGRYPLEFRSIGLDPEPWTMANVTANLVVNSWYLQTNYLEEVLAIRTRNKLTRAQWDAIIPGMSAFDGNPLPVDEYFEKIRDRKIGKFIPATYSFFKEFNVICGASNNWITSDGPGGKPLLANDPHLGIQVPQIWFACGLHCPGTDILGVGMPGFPGIIIGRTPSVAWGLTNVMTDIVDLFVMKVDPVKNTCVVNGKELPLITREETYRLSDGRQEVRKIHSSPHGPLLTELTSETNAAVALKWYGTLPGDAIIDRTVEGLIAFSGVRNIDELRAFGSYLSTIGQNIVAGDADGHIMWQATGSIPLRRGYSGRLPADGSADHDWTGFVPFEDMPGSRNPEEKYIATANHRTVPADHKVMPTWSWGQPWRIRRIRQGLETMGNPTFDKFAALQNDTVSVRPAHVLKTFLDCELNDERALRLAGILGDWDGNCGKNSAACLIFNHLPTQVCEILLRKLLGNDLELYYNLLPFFTSLMESLARDPGLLKLFPDENTGIFTLSSLMDKALVGIWEEMAPRFGNRPEKWKWGQYHTLHYRHPGATGGLTSWLLNRGPWPADGDWTTVNVCGYSLTVDPGETTTIPSMRFIASLADKDENLICLPLGQSGRPGNRFYDDFAPKYRKGRYVPFPMRPHGRTGRAGGVLILKGT